jgi:hypothetical protein
MEKHAHVYACFIKYISMTKMYIYSQIFSNTELQHAIKERIRFCNFLMSVSFTDSRAAQMIMQNLLEMRQTMLLDAISNNIQYVSDLTETAHANAYQIAVLLDYNDFDRTTNIAEYLNHIYCTQFVDLLEHNKVNEVNEVDKDELNHALEEFCHILAKKMSNWSIQDRFSDE